jgi:hypothetical protein
MFVLTNSLLNVGRSIFFNHYCQSLPVIKHLLFYLFVLTNLLLKADDTNITMQKQALQNYDSS